MDGIMDEEYNDIDSEDNKPLCGINEVQSVKIEQKTLYDYDIVEESKTEYNLEENIAEIYTDNGNKILSNDLF